MKYFRGFLARIANCTVFCTHAHIHTNLLPHTPPQGNQVLVNGRMANKSFFFLFSRRQMMISFPCWVSFQHKHNRHVVACAAEHSVQVLATLGFFLLPFPLLLHVPTWLTQERCAGLLRTGKEFVTNRRPRKEQHKYESKEIVCSICGWLCTGVETGYVSPELSS